MIEIQSTHNENMVELCIDTVATKEILASFRNGDTLWNTGRMQAR